MRLFLHRVTYLLALSLVTLTTQAQSKKWANAIEITAAVSDSTLIESAVSVFEDQGYVVLKSDFKRGTIVTDQKSIGVASLRILGDVKAGVLRLRGQWSGSAMGMPFTNAVSANHGTAQEKKTFQAVAEVAQKISDSLTGSSVAYIEIK